MESFRRFLLASAIAFVFSLALTASRANAGGSCVSCGGDEFRNILYDLSVDTFNDLTDVANGKLITLNDGCRAVSATALQNALLNSLKRNGGARVFNSVSDENCPLKETFPGQDARSGSCVDFRTTRSTGLMEVDVDRLVRHQVDLRELRRDLIHEAYWDLKGPGQDSLRQCSRQLEQKVYDDAGFNSEIDQRLQDFLKRHSPSSNAAGTDTFAAPQMCTLQQSVPGMEAYAAWVLVQKPCNQVQSGAFGKWVEDIDDPGSFGLKPPNHLYIHRVLEITATSTTVTTDCKMVFPSEPNAPGVATGESHGNVASYSSDVTDKEVVINQMQSVTLNSNHAFCSPGLRAGPMKYRVDGPNLVLKIKGTSFVFKRSE